jgi:hypothetical protein
MVNGSRIRRFLNCPLELHYKKFYKLNLNGFYMHKIILIVSVIMETGAAAPSGSTASVCWYTFQNSRKIVEYNRIVIW